MAKSLIRLAVLCAVSVLTFGAQTLLAQGNDQLKIGFSAEATKGERWQTDLNAFQLRAKQLGAEVISSDASGDDDLQLQQVKEMIKTGIKVLVLLPHDTTKAGRIVDAAKAAGVKVLSYDRLAQNSDVDLYVSFNRVEIGRMQAESLLKVAPAGNYVLIAGSPNDEGAKTLHDEQLRVLQPHIDRGEIKVVADSYTNDWLPAEAYIHMLEAIDSSKGNIAAVLASNDAMAGGAIQALREHNLAGKVAVSGQDADLTSLISIAQGAQTMTVYKSITTEANMAAEQAAHMARGEKTDADEALNNGKIKVPAILLKPVEVTKDNIVSTVVQDGFQQLKDINQALPADQQIH